MKSCNKTYNFKDPKSDLDAKKSKKDCLLELVDYMNANKNVFNEEILKEVVRMVENNIFRTLGGQGLIVKSPIMDPDEEEPNLDEAWPHL